MVEKAFADASAAAKTVRDSFMVDRISRRGNSEFMIAPSTADLDLRFTDVLPYIAGEDTIVSRGNKSQPLKNKSHAFLRNTRKVLLVVHNTIYLLESNSVGVGT